MNTPLLSENAADQAATTLLEGLKLEYLHAMASGRGEKWAHAAHAIIDLLAAAPELAITRRADLEGVPTQQNKEKQHHG